jgi:uncharacterized membrane protein YhhN
MPTMDLNKYKGFTLFFVLVFICNLAFFVVLKDYRMVAKPMIMMSLIGFYITHVSPQNNGLLMGLIMALFGDIFLLFEISDMFMVGLICFLVMQLLYANYFYQHRGKDPFNLWFLLLVACAVAVISMMWPHLGDMSMPVIVYSASILLMAYMAVHCDSSKKGYNLIAIGAIFFVISDMLLAWAKFVGPFLGHPYLVMGTYMIAQYTIVRGIIEDQAIVKAKA